MRSWPLECGQRLGPLGAKTTAHRCDTAGQRIGAFAGVTDRDDGVLAGLFARPPA